MLIAHKIALDPTQAQTAYFSQGCGVARVAWNWALAEWQRQYAARKVNPSLPRSSEATLRRLLNRLKDERFPWMRNVTKAAPQQAIKNLGRAFTRFFAKEAHYPKFKKKGRHDSFRADNGPATFRCEGKRIKLPVIGWVRMREALRFTGRPLSVSISREADRWFPSSKTCSACGAKLGMLPLAVRKWTCPACGAQHDRDVNAAINLRNLAVSSTVSASGETGSGRCLATVQPVSVKQEPVAAYASA